MTAPGHRSRPGRSGSADGGKERAVHAGARRERGRSVQQGPETDRTTGMGQRSLGQRNGGKGMKTKNSCPHSFASIPLPKSVSGIQVRNHFGHAVRRTRAPKQKRRLGPAHPKCGAADAGAKFHWRSGVARKIFPMILPLTILFQSPFCFSVGPRGAGRTGSAQNH